MRSENWNFKDMLIVDMKKGSFRAVTYQNFFYLKFKGNIFS